MSNCNNAFITLNNIMPYSRKDKLTIVIPVFNECENISIIIDKLVNILVDCIKFEVVFVDDGSTDGTLAEIKRISKLKNNIFYLSFSRNFGHQNALRAGLSSSDGDCVVTMDGDLQHPPELIPEMIKKWRQGFDIVFTTREDNVETGMLKQITASYYYRIINKIADIELQHGAADFRLMTRNVVQEINRFDERAIFYRGLVSWLGYKQCKLSYTAGHREFGNSKYSLTKMIALAINGIVSFSLFPLRAAAVIGLLMATGSFVYVLYAILIKFCTDNAVSGWLSIMAGIYFLGGVQLVFLGLFGEYIGKIFMEVRRRPNYIIADSNVPKQNVK
jgi:dolichol-phosphate mannosyltransferase